MLEKRRASARANQTLSGRFDQMPGLVQFFLGDHPDVRNRIRILESEEGEFLPPIDPGDEPRRRSAESSAGVEQDERSPRTGRRCHHASLPAWRSVDTRQYGHYVVILRRFIFRPLVPMVPLGPQHHHAS